jgi:AraC-like DNA-binding protein
VKILFAHSVTQHFGGNVFHALTEKRIHGAHVRFLKTATGNDIVLQEWGIAEYQMDLITASCRRKDGFAFAIPASGYLIVSCLGGRVKLLEHQAGLCRLTRHHLFVLHQVQFQGFCTFFPSKEIVCLLLLHINKQITSVGNSTTKLGVDPKVLSLLEKAFAVSYKKPGKPQVEMLEELSAYVLNKTVIQGHEIPIEETDAESIQSFKKYLDQSTGKFEGIGTWCRKNGLSQRTLSRGFHLLYGKTLREFVVTSKLDKAKISIESTLRPLKVISKEAGYRSYTNFSYAFKRQFGLTPRVLRKKHLSGRQ